MTDVVMPQMGESIVEGTLTKWLKKSGDHVERDEPLFEISTDKVDTEIPSPAAGTLSEILVQEGATVGINTVVARISDGAAAPAEPAKPAAPETAKPAAPTPETAKPSPEAGSTAPSPAPAASQPEESAEPGGPLSPLVRRMAREHNLDLSRVKGTGAGGRITKHDVESYLAQPAAAPSAPRAEAPKPAVPAPAAPPATEPAPPQAPAIPPPVQGGPAKVRIEPMSAMRTKIAEHMVMSKRTSAHVTTIHKVDMTKVEKLRQKHKADFQARYGMSLTYLPFITRAAVEGLRAYPLLNASIEGSNIVYHNEINIGIAVALENGLIVPVIRNADEKNVLGLQRSIVDLAARARSRQLKPDEVQGGTFSITSFGGFGSVIATPVINQPQVAILGAGVVEKTPVVIDDAIAIRSICYLSLTFDHRLIDGALADQFTGKVKSALENWSDEVL
ncbi:MAG TPA: 2-oxoglutarate dehydrogenase, E2 component, dihydrolipoamide succinyltransferase [Bryobacteraceae bacterium]|nr:2-oxoglutarate dehydrogenase, E2 component, dihydrolipoamide succinyltransferase [Bryobacteraceae bacterium]